MLPTIQNFINSITSETGSTKHATISRVSRFRKKCATSVQSPHHNCGCCSTQKIRPQSGNVARQIKKRHHHEQKPKKKITPKYMQIHPIDEHRAAVEVKFHCKKKTKKRKKPGKQKTSGSSRLAHRERENSTFPTPSAIDRPPVPLLRPTRLAPG